MIEDLIRLFDTLAQKGKVPAYGQEIVNVPVGLEIDDAGELIRVLPLGDTTKKKRRNEMPVPARVVRSSGIRANFLCDTAAYLLGFSGDADNKKASDRAYKCFEASGDLHKGLLSGVESPTAQAVLAFFDKGPQYLAMQELVDDDELKIVKQANLMLYHEGQPVMEDAVIAHVWEDNFSRASDDSEKVSGEIKTEESLVDGKLVVPVNIHPKIKHVAGAQSVGASLVSFNAAAFNSYGKEQNGNAPMSAEQANKYVTALNTLLADRQRTALQGDTTIVFWSESANPQYPKTLMEALGLEESAEGTHRGDHEADIAQAVKLLAQGEMADLDGFKLNPGEHFYILGLAPNAARLSVRFYLKDTFGSFLSNIKKHYDDTAIVRPQYEKTSTMPLWRMLNQTENKKAKSGVPAVLVGSVLRAVFMGTPYPASLLTNVMLRIRVEKDINADKAAIIKAYYLRSPNQGCPKEVLQMTVNEESHHIPYVLGRMFSLYEQIQSAANPDIKTTIKDKYFSAASQTPSMIFPLLGDLAEKHMRKLRNLTPGQQVYLGQQLRELAGNIGEQYPKRLTLPEQGAFQLGYYFQTQKRYEKKTQNETTENNK